MKEGRKRKKRTVRAVKNEKGREEKTRREERKTVLFFIFVVVLFEGRRLLKGKEERKEGAGHGQAGKRDGVQITPKERGVLTVTVLPQGYLLHCIE